MPEVQMTVLVNGRVQGVGFRYWVREQAQALGLGGSATNLRDGRVEVVATGSRGSCESLLAVLRGGAAPGSVSDVAESWDEPSGTATGFDIG